MKLNVLQSIAIYAALLAMVVIPTGCTVFDEPPPHVFKHGATTTPPTGCKVGVSC